MHFILSSSLDIMTDIEYIIETALSYQREGRLEEAAGIYQEILEANPKQSDAMHLLGMVFFSKGDYGGAIRLITEAVQINPSVADYHVNLSSVYFALNELKQARFHAEFAIKCDSTIAEAHYNLGNILFIEGNVDRSLASFKHSLNLDPDNQIIWANYLFALNFSVNSTPEEIYSINRKWGESFEQKIKNQATFENKKTSGRQLKLGYYLPELEKHVTARYLSAILEHHDKSRFELIGYGYRTDNKVAPSDIVDALDRWVDVRGVDVEEVAEITRNDKIDILLHPCTFKSRYRDILAYRAAPIQVACINLVSTTGLSAVDYMVTDDFISPVNANDYLYTEKLIRLSSFNTYKQFSELNIVDSLPVKKNGFITFGSCNNLIKLNSEILKRVKNSRLLLKHRALDNTDRQSSLANFFVNAGVSEERLIFQGFTSDRSDYLNVYNEIDIALDPFPFGGGTVSYEALWMGVPIVTILGSTIMGRLTGSLMHRLGLDDWITNSKKEYVLTAVNMAGKLIDLSNLRHELRARTQNTIFDVREHVLEFEKALVTIWNDYIG